jgi:hypothetical protein
MVFRARRIERPSRLFFVDNFVDKFFILWINIYVLKEYFGVKQNPPKY